MNILRMNMSDENKENSDNRAEQTDGKPVEKYCFTCNQKECTLDAALCHLNSLWMRMNVYSYVTD